MNDIWVHNLNPFLIQFSSSFGIRWYGLAYLTAFIVGAMFMVFIAKRGRRTIAPEIVTDYITYVVLGVMIGGRVGYAVFYSPDLLTDFSASFPFWGVLKVWEGGMASHGGMIGILAFTFYYAHRHKISWTNLGDNLVVTAPLGLFFGRCANFINGELYGRVTNVSWAMQFPKELLESPAEAARAIGACQQVSPTLTTPEAIVAAVHRSASGGQVKEILRTILTPRHPSQLYEAFCEGIVLFAIVWLVRTRLRTPNGFLTGLFFICYAIFRIVVENFREPDASMILGVTRGQFLSAFLILIGVGFIVSAYRRRDYPQTEAQAK